MKLNELATIQNLCSQGNIAKSNKSQISQYNYIVMIGLEYLNDNIKDTKNLPISISVYNTGELEISGLDESIIDNKDSIRIHSEKKVTHNKV